MGTTPQTMGASLEPMYPVRIGATLRWCLGILAMLVAILVAVECGTRLLVPRISRIEGRTVQEYSATITPASDARPVLLFTGNSLLDAGVKVDRVRDAFANQFEVRRFMVEQTVYYDWYYGLRRLFDAGARPRIVVLMLNAGHLVSDGSRGEYSAYTLVNHGDILGFCRDLRLRPTNAANMVFANLSMFYGLRSEIRKVVLSRMMPDLPLLTRRLIVAPPPAVPNDTLRTIVRERSRVLRDECARNGARLVLALPPGLSYDPLLIVKAAAAESGVETLLPFSAEQYTARDFADGFHLNDNGAERFTEQLIAALRQSVGQRPGK